LTSESSDMFKPGFYIYAQADNPVNKLSHLWLGIC